MDAELKELIKGGASEEALGEYAAAHECDPFNVRDLERSEILKVLNGAYIARRFFGKSPCWFSQKLNNNTNCGKVCEFSAEERETLKRALGTIAWEIQEFADNL